MVSQRGCTVKESVKNLLYLYLVVKLNIWLDHSGRLSHRFECRIAAVTRKYAFYFINDLTVFYSCALVDELTTLLFNFMNTRRYKNKTLLGFVVVYRVWYSYRGSVLPVNRIHF